MAPSRRRKSTALAISIVTATTLAASTALLIRDYFGAVGRLPGNKETVAKLDLAVREDASHAQTLTTEYERQRDESLERRDRGDVYTGVLIVSAVAFLLSTKWLVALKGRSAPTLVQIETHRGPARPAKGKRRRHRARASSEGPENAAGAEAPAIDLSFVDEVVAEEGTSKEAAIAILQRIQRHYRYLPDEALERVSELTEISPAQITGVSTFYSQFRRSPVGKYVVKICHGTACHVAGATEITEEVRRHLKIPDEADTDPRRHFTVDEVACVGCCSLAPVLMIEDETVGGLSPASASEAIEAYGEEHGE